MNLFRPAICRIEGYVPGEQPQESGWIKLNTNENPYLPSPDVIDAVTAAASGRLNVYPDPLATEFRRTAAALLDVDPDWILPANGSDENLTILLRSFADSDDVIAFPYPSYILYETLAQIQGCRHERLLLNEDWSWDMDASVRTGQKCKLVFVPNPNSPSGNVWPEGDLLQLIPPHGLLVLDEAYGDFRNDRLGSDMLKSDAGRRIVLTRTLSKSYSLAGIRCGFAVAHPDVIAGMRKVKDSYNCNTLSLAAGVAALRDQATMQKNCSLIRATRERLVEKLGDLGFDVVPSQANFVWATHPTGRHEQIYRELKNRRVLIRYMQYPDALKNGTETLTGLRITVGTDDEIDSFLTVLREIV